jgi:predicted metal-dependent phosphoesterase TrpH
MQEEQLDKVTRAEAEEIKEYGAVQDDHQPDIGTMRVDLHCHSETSWDCITPLNDIPAQCKSKGIQVQAITDHNEVWGAQALKAQVDSDPSCDLTIIVGEEITTTEGEIIGLFLQEQIEPGLTPEETVRQIKAQNGLVLLPHGFDPLKRYRLQPEARLRVADDLDIIETFNARISRPHWNQAAVTWAEERGLLMSAGSDAHRLVDIGAAWVEVPKQPIRTPEDLLAALQDGVPTGDWTHPVWAFILKMWGQAKNRLGLP